MRKFTMFGLLTLCLLFSVSSLLAQRKQVDVPRVDPSAITIDGKADEAAWSTAAKADVITNTGFNGWFNYYGRDVTEPDFPELNAKMLWARDTLYFYIHIKDVVNDSSGLYFPGNEGGSHWSGDQLFVSVSSRLGIEIGSSYDFNVYAAPEGPYTFLITGNRVTLNDSTETHVPPGYQRFPGDTVRVFNAHSVARWATVVDTTTGEWDVEMAIYNPDIAPGANIGFNFGGSQGSRFYANQLNNQGKPNNDAYAYWTWQPNVQDSPFAVPNVKVGAPGDPGGYNLINSDYWALLNFVPGAGDVVRKVVTVPRVDSGMVKIDGKADEAVWKGAAKADVITNTGFNGWFNYYGRDVTEPDFPELNAKMLWMLDTLYFYIHIKDVVNDSSGLYFPGNEGGSHWSGDQLFVSISSRLADSMGSNYDFNVYTAPDGPYNYLIYGNKVTLNDSSATNIPLKYQKFPGDTVKTFNAHDFARWGTVVDTATGEWDVEMAIYQPDVAPMSKIGFNFGGSQGSRFYANQLNNQGKPNNDAYAYWTWQPNVQDSPFAVPNTAVGSPGDPGGFNLINSEYWALLQFDTTAVVTGVKDISGLTGIPQTFTLSQNYPNPFNPSTNIQFSIPRAGKVQLKVYDILGQEVATLVNGQYTTGKYEVEFNANRLATGVYFYRLTVDNNTVATRKMMLLK